MAERLLQREVRPAPELDLDDDLAVRTWIMQDTDDDLRAGRTAPELVFLTPTSLELFRAATGDGDRDLAIGFPGLAARPEVRRCFRRGPARLAGEGGARVVVAAFEVGRDDHWWLAYRFRTAEGVVGGAWHQRRGHGTEELAAPFDAWFAAASADLSASPDVRAGVDRLPLDPPTDALGLLGLVGKVLVDQIIEEGGLECRMVLAFRGRTVETWEVRGNLPCSFDDMIRAIAAHARADGLAVVHLQRLELARAWGEALVTVVERGRERREHARILIRGDEGAILGARALAIGPPEPVQWLGVESEAQVALKLGEDRETWGDGDAEG